MSKFFKSISIFLKETNKLLMLQCLILSAFGVLMVHSATLHNLSDGQIISRDTLIMILAICIGVALCLFISLVDYQIIIRLWPLVALVCLALMAALFAVGVGPTERSDAKTWIPIAGFYFQPSELFKIAFIITFSVHLDSVKDNINSIKNIILLGLHGAFPIGLVIITGDLGSALVFAGIFLGMMFISGVYWRYFIAGGALCVAALPILWIKFFSEFQKQRLLAVYYPQALSESTYNAIIYQQHYGMNAIGSGRFTGTGLFNGSYTQNGVVPESENDMILTVIGEELGFIGCIALLIMLALLLVIIVRVGKRAKDNPSKLICYGVAVMIGSQAIINIGMCLKLLPVIGITLPFISAGGSSSLCIYIAMGLVMSIYRYNCERDPISFRVSFISTPFREI